MTQCVVIAVDLTGGNATGVQLKQSDFNSISILNSSMIDNMKLWGQHDLINISNPLNPDYY